jgi:hypothetical protein
MRPQQKWMFLRRTAGKIVRLLGGGGKRICKKFHAKSCDFLSKDLKLACSFIWWLRDGRGAQKGVVMEC